MNWKVVLAIITCNVVLMSSSYTMLIPFLPLYLRTELHADPDTINLWTGVIFAACFAVCAVMAPIWGRMSDRKGRKLMVVRSSSLIALTYLFGGLVQTPMQLLFVRIFQGFAAGLWPASLALMSGYCPKNKIGISMGIMQSANICGGILGPLLGGVLAQEFGMRASFFIGSGTLAFITLVTLLFIKEPPREEKPANAPVPAKIKNPTKSLLTNPGFILILLATGCTNMVILLLQPIMTVYIGQLRGTQDDLLLISGLIFSLSGVSGAIAAPIWGKVGQSKGFFITEVVSMMAAGILIASQFIPSTLLPFVILQFSVGLGFSGIFPSANAMAITSTSPDERGTAFGLMFSAQQIGGTVGPLIGGVLGTYIHLSYIFLLSGSILIILSIVFFFKAPLTMRTRISAQRLHHATEKEFIDLIKKQVADEMHKDASAIKEEQATPADLAALSKIDAALKRARSHQAPEQTNISKDAQSQVAADKINKALQRHEKD